MKPLALLLLALALAFSAAGCGNDDGAVSAGPVPASPRRRTEDGRPRLPTHD